MYLTVSQESGANTELNPKTFRGNITYAFNKSVVRELSGEVEVVRCGAGVQMAPGAGRGLLLLLIGA